MAETTHTEWRRDQLSWTAEFFHSLPFNSSALYYLQTPTRRYGHASTTQQFLPISGDRDVSLPPSLEWHMWSSSSENNCHAVHRSLSSGASLCDGIVRIFFTLSHIVSQAVFYRSTISLLLLPGPLWPGVVQHVIISSMGQQNILVIDIWLH